MKQTLKKITHILPDKLYIRLKYLYRFHKLPNLNKPKTYNEKLQWLKLYDRNPIYTTMVDKFEAKGFIANIIGKEYIVPTLGVWDNFDDIDFEKLPEQFVLKCTHDSGGLVIVRDRSKFDKKEAKKKLESSLKRNYYWNGREWPYKNVKPRIIAEIYLNDGDDHGLNLIEYKLFCFDGEPRFLMVSKGEAHGAGRTNDLFDMNFNHLPVSVTFPNSQEAIKKPKQFEEIIEIARKLSNGIPHLRVDTYIAGNRVYVGELTFFQTGGMCKFKPEKYNELFGEYLKLPLRKNNS